MISWILGVLQCGLILVIGWGFLRLDRTLIGLRTVLQSVADDLQQIGTHLLRLQTRVQQLEAL